MGVAKPKKAELTNDCQIFNRVDLCCLPFVIRSFGLRLSWRRLRVILRFVHIFKTMFALNFSLEPSKTRQFTFKSDESVNFRPLTTRVV